MNTDKLKEMIKIPMEVSIEKASYDGLIEFMVDYPDIFMHDYIGYWAYGIRTPTLTKGWILVEMDNDGKLPFPASHIIESFSQSQLPEGCHILNRDSGSAHRVIVEGMKRFGPDFTETYDANSLDVAIQMALLGEIRYG